MQALLLRSLTISPWDSPDSDNGLLKFMHAPKLNYACVDLVEFTKPFAESIVSFHWVEHATLINCDFIAIVLRCLLGLVSHNRILEANGLPWPRLETMSLILLRCIRYKHPLRNRYRPNLPKYLRHISHLYSRCRGNLLRTIVMDEK